MSGHLPPEDVAGIASLATYDRQRQDAERHARDCAGCRHALDRAAVLLAALDALPSPPPPPAALARARAAVLAEWNGEPVREGAGARPRLLIGAAAAVAWLLTLLSARHHEMTRFAWSAAGAAVAAAGALYTVARDRLALAALLVASIAFAVAEAGPGELHPATGALCALHELVAAALPFAATAWLAASGRATVARFGFAAAATAGALAGQAALDVTCRAASAAPHLFVFHVGGVVLAALAGLALSPRLTARPI